MDKMKVYRIYYNNENIITIRATKLEIEKTETFNYGYFYFNNEIIYTVELCIESEIKPIQSEAQEDVYRIYIKKEGSKDKYRIYTI